MSHAPPPLAYARVEDRGDPLMLAVYAFSLAWGMAVAVRHGLYWTWVTTTPGATFPQTGWLGMGLAVAEVAGYAIVLISLMLRGSLRRWIAIVGFGWAILSLLAAVAARLPELMRMNAPTFGLIFKAWTLWSTAAGVVVPVMAIVLTARSLSRLRP